MKISDQELLQKIEREPRLLNLALMRSGSRLAIGKDEPAWKAMLSATRTLTRRAGHLASKAQQRIRRIRRDAN